MTALCLITGGLIFTVLVVLLGLYDDNSRKTMTHMTQQEDIENYQQKMQQRYEPILDAIDPQRIEKKRKEKLMNDYEYYLLTGELPPTE